MKTDIENLFKDKVLGHPAGLFVLFFTEMWERFSYYGMRAILVIFLTGAVLGDNPGWGWSTSAALSLLGTYALFVYLTPLLGGWLADNKIGYRMAVVIGALLMTLGHASMAFETPTSLYIGIALLIIGNGFFKPNMTSIISKMYAGKDDKKDGAYNIFYMGVNAGAFIGIMLCGWVGEKIGWSYGFGLAGVFMLLGMLQFYYAQPIFGTLGDKPLKTNKEKIEVEEEVGVRNPFSIIDYILIGLFTISALIFIINDPLSKIGNINILNFSVAGLSDSLFFALLAAISFIVLLLVRIPRYTRIERDRMIAFAIFSLFTIFFWAAFEQAA
ncbi:MAG TPA: MFS transporter, partial [Tenacibaculum sp.]|nr:MFS transporter [Tenacibaculum sp.]